MYRNLLNRLRAQRYDFIENLNMYDAQPGLAGGVARVTPPGHGGVIDAAFMVMDLTACGFLAIELA